MLLKLKHLVLVAVVMAQAAPAIAEDIALVIGNRGYRHQDTIRDASKVRQSLDALEEAGFRVFIGENLSQKEQLSLALDFDQAVDRADRVVIFLRGHIVSSDTDAWLLGTDAKTRNMFDVGGEGLSIGALLQSAARKPGGAVFMIGNGDTGVEFGRGLKAGPGAINVPQGVSLVQGPTGKLSKLIADLVSNPGQSLHKAVGSYSSDLKVTGYYPENIPFIEKTSISTSGDNNLSYADRAYWEAVKKIGTIQALQTYLERYPNGQYLYEAEDMISDLKANPERQAKADEERLKLNREKRRQIQRNLSILGFDPRGVDGVFGRGSRAAIAAWQRSRGIEGFGYLTGNQITALQAAADTRSRELEEEAARRRAEQERQDASYWRKTGREGTEGGLRAYLRRYPDGLYSEIARGHLDDIEEERLERVNREERDYWDRMSHEGSAGSYNKYISRYPNGAFVDEAKERIGRLEDESRNAELIRNAKAAEAKVAGNTIARLLIEQKLQRLGLKPGRVDGEFDDKTRRALRKFQRARQMPATGYVTQRTLVRLLAAR